MKTWNPFAGWVQGLRDWSKTKEHAEAIFSMLKMARGPGRGIGIPKRVRPEFIRAVELMLGSHPEVCITQWRNDYLLMFRDDLIGIEQSIEWKVLRPTLQIEAGTDLVEHNDKLDKAGLIDHSAPATEADDKRDERWPGATEGRKPEDVSEQEWAEFNAMHAERKAKEAAAEAEKEGA